MLAVQTRNSFFHKWGWKGISKSTVLLHSLYVWWKQLEVQLWLKIPNFINSWFCQWKLCMTVHHNTDTSSQHCRGPQRRVESGPKSVDFKPDCLIITCALHPMPIPLPFLLAEHSSARVCCPQERLQQLALGTLLQPDGIRGYSATIAVISASMKASQDTTKAKGWHHISWQNPGLGLLQEQPSSAWCKLGATQSQGIPRVSSAILSWCFSQITEGGKNCQVLH